MSHLLKHRKLLELGIGMSAASPLVANEHHLRPSAPNAPQGLVGMSTPPLDQMTSFEHILQRHVQSSKTAPCGVEEEALRKPRPEPYDVRTSPPLRAARAGMSHIGNSMGRSSTTGWDCVLQEKGLHMAQSEFPGLTVFSSPMPVSHTQHLLPMALPDRFGAFSRKSQLSESIVDFAPCRSPCLAHPPIYPGGSPAAVESPESPALPPSSHSPVSQSSISGTGNWV